MCEVKGLTKKSYPSALGLIKPYLHAKFEVCGYYGYWVSLLQLDPQEEEREEHEEVVNIAHIVDQDFRQGLMLMVVLTLMLVDESEISLSMVE